MVGHESVDPKPQAKADLVTGVMCCIYCEYGCFFLSLCVCVFCAVCAKGKCQKSCGVNETKESLGNKKLKKCLFLFSLAGI